MNRGDRRLDAELAGRTAHRVPANRFLAAYTVELEKDMLRRPAEYGIRLTDAFLADDTWNVCRDAARETAGRMVSAMATGGVVYVSNAMRRAARKLGVKPTVTAIHAYVRAEVV